MATQPSDPPAGALAVTSPGPLAASTDARRGSIQMHSEAVEVGPGQKGARVELVNVEERATAHADGTRVRSWTRTEQHIEVIAPSDVAITAHVVEHAPVLGRVLGVSETARLLKLDNDDDYTDDDFDDDDGDDDDDEDLDDDGEPIVEPARQLAAAPVALPVRSTSWQPPLITVRRGNISATVPDIGAIAVQLDELTSSVVHHRRVARAALALLEPLAHRAMQLGAGRRDELAALRDQARDLAAGPLLQAETAREQAAADLAHGQLVSQRATGSPRVKEKLDALVAAATETREAAHETARLLRALEEAAG